MRLVYIVVEIIIEVTVHAWLAGDSPHVAASSSILADSQEVVLTVGLHLVSNNLPSLVALEVVSASLLASDLLQQIQIKLVSIGTVLWLNIGFQDCSFVNADWFDVSSRVARVWVELVGLLTRESTARMLSLHARLLLLCESHLALPATSFHASSFLWSTAITTSRRLWLWLWLWFRHRWW